MFSDAEKNYFLDASMFMFSLVCMATGIILHLKPSFAMAFLTSVNFKPLHIWTGYLMAGIILLHLLRHVKWISVISRKIWGNKVKVLTLVLTILVTAGVCYFINTSSEIDDKGGRGNFPGERIHGSGDSFGDRGKLSPSN